MARLLVTVGTDGFTNWVQLPTGQRLNLGIVSVLSFVTKLARGRREARAALDGFLRDGEAMVTVDEGSLWDILAPVRARWASKVAGPFMTTDPRTPREAIMSINENDLKALETHVAALNKAASREFAGKVSSQKMEQGRALLVKYAQRIQLAAQEEEQDETAEEEKSDKEASLALAFDTVKANGEIAGNIIAKAEETVEKIDRLAAAGRPFNASKAKADIHAVTTKVASILREADLSKDWVKSDLQKLAARADQLHGLFASAKV